MPSEWWVCSQLCPILNIEYNEYYHLGPKWGVVVFEN